VTRAPHFEERYRARHDPWDTLTGAYELQKRERTLRACGDGPFAAACDLGAGLGLVSAALAPRCARLVAIDAAPTAARAARRRLRASPHATVLTGALPGALPAGTFDLVVASEILYYLDDDAFAATLAWLGTAASGRVVAVHWRGTAPDLRRSADAAGAALAGVEGLRPVEVERAPGAGYRLDVLERAA
jgi:SAM-dependent methyltransferase